jgi:hypothetical protein
MHVPHGIINNTEQCGIGGLFTGFDARQTAELEDESRKKEWKFLLNRDSTKKEAARAKLR